MENHIGWYLENNNSQKHKLVSKVDGVLVDPNILCKAIGERAREIHAVELEDQKTEKEEWQNGEVNSDGTISDGTVLMGMALLLPTSFQTRNVILNVVDVFDVIGACVIVKRISSEDTLLCICRHVVY